MGIRQLFNSTRASDVAEKVQATWIAGMHEIFQSLKVPSFQTAIIIFLLTAICVMYLRIPRQKQKSQMFESINTNVLHTPLNKVRAGWELDTVKILERSNFTLKPQALMTRAREVFDKAMSMEGGLMGLSEDDIGDDFRAVFQPSDKEMNKSTYLSMVQKMKLKEAFPNFCPNVFCMVVDPLNPRVWMLAYPRATHSKPSEIFGQPTNVAVVLPPSVFSLTFNPEGKVVYLTAGFQMDYSGSTKGVPGFFGLQNAIGRGPPIPESKPYSPSIGRSLFHMVSGIPIS